MDIGEICEQAARAPKTVPDALDRLDAVRLGIVYFGKKRRETIAYLREQKVSWQEIADVLQVTPSAVYQRFTRASVRLDEPDQVDR